MRRASWAYFDTSTLVKRYVKEKGTAAARRALGRSRFLSSAILPLEVLSSLCRRRIMGDLAAKDFSAILARVNADRAYWELIEVSPLVLTRAEELILSSALRTLDAIHLASALTFQHAMGLTLPFITSDERQGSAARRCGLEVLWVA